MTFGFGAPCNRRSNASFGRTEQTEDKSMPLNKDRKKTE
jgi:hypothetical protein